MGPDTVREISDPEYPRGCFLDYGYPAYFAVAFNTDPNGTVKKDGEPFCKMSKGTNLIVSQTQPYIVRIDLLNVSHRYFMSINILPNTI